MPANRLASLLRDLNYATDRGIDVITQTIGQDVADDRHKSGNHPGPFASAITAVRLRCTNQPKHLRSRSYHAAKG